MAEKDKETKAEKEKNYELRQIKRLLRFVVGAMKLLLGSADIAALEKETGVDLNKDGKIGSTRVIALVSVLAACLIGVAIGGQAILSLDDNDASLTTVFEIRGDGDGTCVTTNTGSLYVSEGVTAGSGFTGTLTANGDITLANGATIDEATADDVQVTFGSDATNGTLGQIEMTSGVVSNELEDGDVAEIVLNAVDSLANETSYAKVILEADDITHGTEDGAIRLNVFTNGVAADVARVDASGIDPAADDTWDLGSSGAEWKDLYVDGTANLDAIASGFTLGEDTPTTADVTVYGVAGSNVTFHVTNGLIMATTVVNP